ncbi:MAG TPA: 4Fe-4S binding protein, partial [Polaromonas sp.]|nr:4Fe-4S binding protein [Polaromonas sp.]
MTTTQTQSQGCAFAEALEDNYIQEHKAPSSLGGPVVRGNDALEGFYTPLQSLPFFELHKEKCIQCHNCVRICNEVQHRSVYTVDEIGYPALVSGTYNFRDTECNNCGQCVSACPTGALKNLLDSGKLLSSQREKVSTVCSYCGVGCA